MQEINVEVRPDFLERQAKAQPIQALAELIWNGLDADATSVNVEIENDALGGMSKIVVADNGHGMPHAEAPQLFKNLGGSWKRQRLGTLGRNRMLHGQEGRGRFKAFALGGVVDWKVVYDNGGTPSRYDITVLEREIERVRISDEQPSPGAVRGVTVVVSELKRQFNSLKPENAVQELSEIFAIYLKDYRDVSIAIGSEKIDPNLAIANAGEFTLSPIVDEQGAQHSVILEVIEWRRQTRRTLYLCSEQGFPLSQVETRFHVGDFHFSAYLKSSFIRDLHRDGRLDLAEMVPDLATAIEEARKKIKELFRSRAAERARIVVDQWKEDKVYPYEGDATTPLETAERQIFDIVAVTVQDASPDFRETPPKQAALHLRLLRHAIERSPTELQRILDEVLKLPKRKQKELAELLDETDLSGIISAATLIADRLKFLEALRFILFDYEARQKLRERSQLHKILEQNTWIFGEEYNLWASDKDLTTVLKAHSAKLDPDLVIDDPVKVVNKTRGIVDLMLSRAQRRHRHNDLEHLVIELKAPKVVINAIHLMQIEGYALAVEEDPRFNRVDGLRWHFWIVSDEYNKEVEARIKNGPDPQRRLIQKGARISVGVKTWGEILEENNARLQFVKEKLEHRVDDGQALAYLQERHREFLEGVLVEGEEGEAAATSEEAQATTGAGAA
ncbi:ATP-binding protein [Bradyrhizobium diazoefficiens]|nr:ATP-binding protein [Bradyrhizobium diazoefficiens]MBR0703435.1 ATP-binding protein [Bradyrhizobium diazoefficiens]MBR0772191.1 ATP-binding protein [Bradyrhizobium diazoefficiens]